jgi:serine/threonine kinase
MFWASSNEQNAKISLRNALHKIRKSFREDVILSPNKSILTLNKDLDIEIDVEKFQKDPLSNFEVYTGDFLKGFYVKESIDFDYWVLEINTFYKELFIKTAEKKIEEDFLENKFESLETSITSLLANDNFNDKAYLYLMKFYKQKGRYDKIINEYKNIEKLMEDELGIEPPNEIKKIYKEALNFIEKGKEITLNKNKIDVYCRDFELDSMQVNLNNFEKEHSNQSILITGESGIGKTFLKKEILNRNKGKFKIFETACFSMEKDFSYLPWMNIIKDMENELLKSNLTRPNLWDKILKNLFFDGVNNIQPSSEILENKENFNVDLIYNSIYSALDILSKNKKIIIVFEDIQWADQLSIKLLINLILHIHSNIIFILTKTNGIDTGTDRLFLTLKDLNKILAIDLNPFSKREIELIIKRNVSQKKINDEEINEIFEKSKGNPFFLSEYIELFKKNKKDNEITSKLYNVLQDKFLNLTEDEMNILKIISVFYGDVNLDTLLKLINLKPFETLKVLNLLIEKNIIEEKKKDNEVIITFTYSAYKDYIFNEMNDSSKQIINMEIAKTLEEELSSLNNITIYNKLKYHYQKANENIKTLKYDVFILNYYLNFNHEIFPNLDDFDLSKQVKLFIGNDKTNKWMNEIEKELMLVKKSKMSSSDIEEIKKIELIFIYCKGRYLIREGSYTDGVNLMNRVIRVAKDLKEEKVEISAHKQMAIYAIQINNSQIMLKHIIEGIKIAKKEQTNDIGIFYRLYGVYYLIKDEFKTAEALFKKSIELFLEFQRVGDKNSISIAASYNYIGEIRNSEGDFEKAMELFDKAISLCQNYEASCLSTFYINAGRTSYLIGNFQDMKNFFLKAEKIIKNFDSYWKNSVLNAFLALDAFLEDDNLKVIHYLKCAISEGKIINNPRDIGMVYFVEAIIVYSIENKNIEKYEDIKKILIENSNFYYYKAIKYLDSTRDKAEIEYLKNFLNIKNNK